MERLLSFVKFINESGDTEGLQLVLGRGAEEGWRVVALADGERVGELSFIESGFGPVLKASSVVVDPAWRRRGIASSMYSFAEERLGKRFVRNDSVLTPDGRAFWAGRPQGLV